MSTDSTPGTVTFCAQCNSPLTIQQARKGSRFCSRKCGAIARGQRSAARKSPVACPECQSGFIRKNKRQKYCSPECVLSFINSRGKTPAAERFAQYVQRSEGCWEWTGAKNNHGYGNFSSGDGKYALASRFAWELWCGPIPPGMLVCHRCDNPSCVRPDHMFLGTHGDNNRDCRFKGRNARGERHGRSKLTETQVREILRRAKSGERQAALAREFGVGPMQVSCIVRGKKWAHLHPVT